MVGALLVDELAVVRSAHVRKLVLDGWMHERRHVRDEVRLAVSFSHRDVAVFRPQRVSQRFVASWQYRIMVVDAGIQRDARMGFQHGYKAQCSALLDADEPDW